ncbi:protein trichome birefringence-like 43 [Cannabis sativa]|uniref:protein trichome birefringence-like 43 n=1 Tax=Cannabis sativa TaxID=3483 RepID=UPI0029CA347D|nr:protein trichome birefringence-like 43 [Cannabis sativa]
MMGSIIMIRQILAVVVFLLLLLVLNEAKGNNNNNNNIEHHDHFNRFVVHGNNDIINNTRIITTKGCDFWDGNWVYDTSYPLYDTLKCPFVEKEFDCVQNGRPDKLYLKLRWQPTSCKLPRFDGRDFLTRFRGKSIMFVGDSLSLNQWQSLTCMLHTANPLVQYKSVRVGDLSVFSFPAYNLKIMFSRNAFLVDIVGTSVGRVLQLDSVRGATLWKNVDVLIFNTWHWWLHTGRKQPWDLIQDGQVLVKDMNRLVAYEKALNTWAKWVDTNVDPAKTRVFFQGVSPDHNNATEWGDMSGRSCSGQAKALSGLSYKPGPHPAELVVERVVRSISMPVTLLNVTALSQLRKDGHPSFYGHGGHRDMDCSHWCLAGVPDTWNILLYASLIQN